MQEINTFGQLEGESLVEAWDRFHELLRKCPHHRLTRWMQVHTFYNGMRNATRTVIEEEKRKKEESSQGMESNFGYGFLLWNSKVCMNFHAIGWLLVVPKPRVCWDFILTKEVLKLELVKLKKGTRW